MERKRFGLFSGNSEIQAFKQQRKESFKKAVASAKETYQYFKKGQQDIVIFFSGDFVDKKGERVLLPDGSSVPYVGQGGLGEKLWAILGYKAPDEFIGFEISKEPEGDTPAIREFYADAKRKRKLWGGNRYDGLDQTPTEIIYCGLTRKDGEITFLTLETYMDLFEPGEQMSVSWILRRLKTDNLSVTTSQTKTTNSPLPDMKK